MKAEGKTYPFKLKDFPKWKSGGVESMQRFLPESRINGLFERSMVNDW